MRMQRLWAMGVLLTTILAVPLLAGTKTWTGGTSGDWGVSGNWAESAYPVDGDDLVFPISSNTASFKQPNNNTLANLVVKSVTFSTNTATPGPLTLAGNAFTLDGSLGAAYTLSNNNPTAGREVTISNAIAISGDQRWSGNKDNDAVVILAGNVSGTGSLLITNLASNAGAAAVKPAFRLGGSNSGYTGTIRIQNQGGLCLLSPASMIGGLIDLSYTDSNVHLTGNDPSTPYTFGVDNVAGAPNINFAKASISGLYLTGGDVYWNPANGADYSWPAGTLSTIYQHGSADTTPRMLTLGNSSGKLILTGDRTLASEPGVNVAKHAGHLTLRSALADDATGGRLLTVQMYDTILTRPAVENGATPSRIAVNNPGMLAVSNMNQLFSGNLTFNNGGMIFNNLSWGDFIDNRSGGYGASIPAGSTPATITATAGGTLAVGSYCYRVVAVTAAGTSSAGTFTKGTTAGSNLTLPISWAAQTGASLYRLYRNPGATNFLTGDLIYEGNIPSVTDNGLPILQSRVALPTTDTTVGTRTWAFSSAGGGFAAHGTPVTIDDRQTTPLTFDRNFFLGSPLLDSDGSPWANVPVILNRGEGADTISLSATADRTLSTFGPSVLFSGAYYDLLTAGPINEIAGRIGGGGASRKLFIPGNSHNGGPGNSFGMLRLSNTGNTFQATVALETGTSSGYGVLLATDDRVLGSPANAVSLRTDISTGWLLLFEQSGVGEKTFGRTLTITNGSGRSETRAVGFGAYAGNIVYTGTVNTIGITNASPLSIGLYVESGSLLKLGDATTPATLANNRTPSGLVNNTNQYRKLGQGTAVLQNLQFTDAGTSTHIIQIGRGGGGVTNYTYPISFDGAIRETGNSANNSFSGQNIVLAGGVLETCDAVLGGAFVRAWGTGADQIQWAANSGGGFSAYGGPLTVNLSGQTPAAAIQYATNPYMPRKQTLMFGSRTATHVVTLLNPAFVSGSGSDAMEIRVIDNPSTNTDRAVMAGMLSGSVGGTTAFVYKGGDGVLEFASGMHAVHTGMTMVCSGALVVNGSIDKLSGGYNVYVTNNATLAGNGRVDRNVIMIGGALSPGDLAPSNVVGTLTVTNLTMSATSTLNLDLGAPGSSDKLVVLGPLTLAGTINVTNVAGFASGSYEIATYIGALNNTAVMGALPAGVTATINTDTAGKVLLNVSGAGGTPRGALIIIR